MLNAVGLRCLFVGGRLASRVDFRFAAGNRISQDDQQFNEFNEFNEFKVLCGRGEQIRWVPGWVRQLIRFDCGHPACEQLANKVSILKFKISHSFAEGILKFKRPQKAFRLAILYFVL